MSLPLSLLEASLESNRDGILIVDFEQKSLDFNSRLLELWNVTEDQVRGLSTRQLVELVLDQIIDPAQAIAFIETLKYEPRTHKSDVIHLKSRRVMEIHSKPLLAQGQVRGRICFYRDISEDVRKKLIEEARSETMTSIAMGASLKTILDSIIGGVERVHPDMRCSVLLLDRDEKQAMSASVPSLASFYNQAFNGIVIGPDISSCGRAAYGKTQRIVDNLLDHPFGTPYRTLAASTGLRTCWSEPILDADQKVLGSFEISHAKAHSPSEGDLVMIREAAHIAAIAIQRKRAEEEIISQGRRFRSVFEESNDAIILSTKDGSLDCNRRAWEMFEVFGKEDFMTCNLMTMSPPFQPNGLDSSAAAQYHLMQGYQEGNHQYEWMFRTSKGRDFPAEVILRSFPFDGQRVLQFTIRDISDRKLAEQAINLQQEKLVAASKLSSLGEMAGGVAHEVNNPLAIIIGQTCRIRRRMECGNLDPIKLTQDLENIEATAHRIAKIIKGLCSFSRNSVNDPMEVKPLYQIVEETLDLCQEKIRNHSIQLILDIDHDIQLQCRPGQIAQVLMNLLSNAYDATLGLSEKWIKLEAFSLSNWVSIIVTDSGQGIEPFIREKIMEPFFTTKEVGRGTGLGLSISRGISEDHGGRLYYDARADHTSFVVILPLNQGRPETIRSRQIYNHSSQLQA